MQICHHRAATFLEVGSAVTSSATARSSSPTTAAKRASDGVRPTARREITRVPGHRVYLDDAQRAWATV